MNFQQTKLTKSEWQSCEVPVSSDEKRVLELIRDGFHQPSIKYNTHKSFFVLMKIENHPETEVFIFLKYFYPMLKDMMDAMANSKLTSTATAFTGLQNYLTRFTQTTASTLKQLKKKDVMRLSNLDANIQKQRAYIFEYVVLGFCSKICDIKKNERTSSSSMKRMAATMKSGENETIPKDAYISLFLFNIFQLRKASIAQVNKYVLECLDLFVASFEDTGSTTSSHRPMAFSKHVEQVFLHSYDFIERNPVILQYQDMALYSHQKQLFQLFANKDEDASYLVCYTAPTGTGKTLSPLGLAARYRVIYICASRHIGLAFARNAIALEQKVAFAFGCETSSDIRLHYYAVKDYEKNKKTGGFGWIDHSNGEKVEIMICDVASYLIAMYYMLSFNQEKDIVMYWDEPTISMDLPIEDKETDGGGTTPHIVEPLHLQIHEIWKHNEISNIILSCATLPSQEELTDVFMEYRSKFDRQTEIHCIESFEYRKTTTLIDKNKYAVMPHFIFEDFDELSLSVRHCISNPSILRYFSLVEIVEFVSCIHQLISAFPEALEVRNYFTSLEELTMERIKSYYLTLLGQIGREEWSRVFEFFQNNRNPFWKDGVAYGMGVGMASRSVGSNSHKGLIKIRSMEETASHHPITKQISLQEPIQRPEPPCAPEQKATHPTPSNTDGILLTTTDAHTLTDGVSIFFTEDVEKIGKFMIYQSKIPAKILDLLADKIKANITLEKRLEQLSSDLEDKLGKDILKEKKAEKENYSPEIKQLIETIQEMKGAIHHISLDKHFIPNTKPHQNIWWDLDHYVSNAYVPSVDEETVKEVMILNISMQQKLLLLMGIGVFDSDTHDSASPDFVRYREIIKKKCSEQRLYLIIAKSDFIYGINYQMCHAFFGKDLKNMTPQKILQAFGRVGRGNIQQEYTIRIRDDEIFRKILLPIDSKDNIEARNMSILFSSGVGLV